MQGTGQKNYTFGNFFCLSFPTNAHYFTYRSEKQTQSVLAAFAPICTLASTLASKAASATQLSCEKSQNFTLSPLNLSPLTSHL
jgi:hypothetical protein